MDATEEEKLAASALIADLRAQIKTLTEELRGVKISRDTYMNENAQMKRQLAMQRKQLGLK
jgi:TPP-dependent trihydroxycyclohexane-1,2-dione (THcHDO) dehydratase